MSFQQRVPAPRRASAANARAPHAAGHGTYVREGVLLASVGGVVQRVNKLISVTPLKSRFGGQVGDVIVGRVTEVGQKRWNLDVASTQAAILMLSSVNLPGGEQRRRTYEDQLNMRSLYAEGDLVSAEIHQFFQDGAMSVHTRSRKYGKLQGGLLVQVPAYLVRKMKQHFHPLGDLGLHLILSSNGYLWLSPRAPPEADLADDEDEAAAAAAAAAQDALEMTPEERAMLARARAAVLALAQEFLEIFPAAILDVYKCSLDLGIPAADMLETDKCFQVTAPARSRRDAALVARADGGDGNDD